MHHLPLGLRWEGSRKRPRLRKRGGGRRQGIRGQRGQRNQETHPRHLSHFCAHAYTCACSPGRVHSTHHCSHVRPYTQSLHGAHRSTCTQVHKQLHAHIQHTKHTHMCMHTHTANAHRTSTHHMCVHRDTHVSTPAYLCIHTHIPLPPTGGSQTHALTVCLTV